MTVQVYVGLGANIEPEHCLRAGVAALRDAFGKTSQIQLSPVYQTQAVGLDGPDFLNMVVGFTTRMSITELRAWIKDIESKNGRLRHQPQPSCHRLDMDLLLYGDLISAEHNLPRSDVLQRAYVLQPLADIASALFYPGTQQTMASCWQQSQLDQVTTPIDMDFTD